MKILKKIRNLFNMTQEELAKLLGMEDRTIVYQYETRANPSIKVLKKLSEIFEFSMDYIAIDEQCIYPRNLKLLTLSQSVDGLESAGYKNHIAKSAEIFLGENKKADVKQDNLGVKLTDDFHQNLKIIRTAKDISQVVLADQLGVGRTAITLYERDTFPSMDNLIKLSSILEVSMHALVTGKTLSFQFKDLPFGNTMLLADRLLSLEQQKNLTDQMEAVLKK